jgi:hypothetical protein
MCRRRSATPKIGASVFPDASTAGDDAGSGVAAEDVEVLDYMHELEVSACRNLGWTDDAPLRASSGVANYWYEI